MSAAGERRFVISRDDLLESSSSTVFDNVKDDRICVVAVVGKEGLGQHAWKTSVINQIAGRDAFHTAGVGQRIADLSSGRCQCYIEGFYNENDKTLYLSVNTVHDTAMLINQCETLSSEISENGVYTFWQNEEYQQARALLYIFHLAHIILFLEPGSSFDTSYIRFFRTIDNIRTKLQSRLSELLKPLSISDDWTSSARICSPRVLFAFTNSHVIANDDKKVVKRLQHAIEDQIYRILRKARIITNVSNNSLFAVPANEEFVHIFGKQDLAFSPMDNYLNMLTENCLRKTETDSPKSFSQPSSLGSLSSFSDLSSFRSNKSSDSAFKDFIKHHVDLALTKGFDDNIGRSHIPPVFEIPKLTAWFKVAECLQTIFFGDTKDKPRVNGHFNTLNSLLDIDNRFSDNRCSKILPLAESTYQEGLPKHYTTSYHQRRLSKAEKVYHQHARGPAMTKYYKRLEQYCDKFWKNGHQLCEEVSLSGRHCVHELHNVSESALTPETEHLPVKAHSSQLKMKAACNCGRTQTEREDPFTHKEANFDFYSELEKKCCGTLENIRFPVFKPSIAEARSGDSLLGKSAKRESTKTDLLTGMSGLSLALSLGQSGAGGSDLFLHGDQGRLTPVDHSVVDTATQDESADVEQQSKSDRVVSPDRQHSTTEYLAGMVHSNSPSGLLPKFSSWSLCALGKSTVYVPSQGLDHPGFLSGSNYLLPWDVTVKCDRDKWPSVGESSNKKGKFRKGQKESSELNMRIYVGMDYECPRGHRFFCSGPDKILKSSGSQMKDTASKLLASDMPLYFPCTCRPGGQKTCLAQLMRLYVSIPDGPVQIAVNPRVQPAAGASPVFYPEEQGPIKLPSGSLWVLRFPQVYMSEDGPLLPPAEPHLLPACRLFKGVLSIATD